MKKYKAIIVDDEKKNIKILDHFLKKFCPLIDVVKTCESIKEAIEFIRFQKPDILYLDIKLNNGTSFHILQEIETENLEVIFITAFKDYAIEAIKINAIDYILKPLSIEDVVLSTNKAIDSIEKKILLNLKGTNRVKDYITVHSIDNIEIIKKEDLLYCQSDGRYTTLWLADRKVIASKNLGVFEELLKGSFIRVHNSYLINYNHIKIIHKKNGFFCEMKNGKRIPVSKRKQYLISEL